MADSQHVEAGLEYAVDGHSVIGMATALIQLLLALVPVSQAKALLTAEEVRRARIEADALEDLKFGRPENKESP